MALEPLGEHQRTWKGFLVLLWGSVAATAVTLALLAVFLL